MQTVNILDRSSMLEKLYDGLVIDPAETAIVTIDMHRGHLDMDVATMPTSPEDAKRVIGNARDVLGLARRHGIPVIHVILVYRDIPGLGSEGMAQPYWRALHDLTTDENRLTPGRRSTCNNHNIEGSPGTEIIAELRAPDDYVIDNKKRLDCFHGTDLQEPARRARREDGVPDGHQHQYLRAQHVVHRVQLQLPRRRHVRLRRQHVRRRPPRARPAECVALPGLGGGQSPVRRKARPGGGAEDGARPGHRTRLAALSIHRRISMTIDRRTFLKGAAGAGITAAAGSHSPLIFAQSNEPIRVGLLTVKTGPLASGGIDMERAHGHVPARSATTCWPAARSS